MKTIINKCLSLISSVVIVSALSLALFPLSFAPVHAAPAPADIPSYNLQWGTFGSGNGQFNLPYG
ncbi:MAG: hypothetical protein WAS94_03435, partial [Candidatus Saccharimonadales bacterium]